MSELSIPATAYAGALASYDVDHDSRITPHELRELPAEVAASLVKQSFSQRNTAPAGYGPPPTVAPLSTGALDREAAVTVLSALKPSTLAQAMTQLDDWRSSNQHEHRVLSNLLVNQLGPPRYAETLNKMLDQGATAAQASPWVQALDSRNKQQVVLELGAQSDPDAINPLLAKSLPNALADHFRDHRVVIAGEVHSEGVRFGRAIKESLPVLKAMGVTRIAVEMPQSDQAALNKVASGSNERSLSDADFLAAAKRFASNSKEPLPPGIFVQARQMLDPDWVDMIQAAHSLGFEVAAVDMNRTNFSMTTSLAEQREAAITEAITSSPGKTLVIYGWHHGVQNVNQTQAPLASRLNAQGVPTASVKLESASSTIAAMKLGASVDQATAANGAFWHFVKSEDQPTSSFAYPTHALGNLRFLHETPSGYGAMGVPPEPRYRDSFDDVVLLAPSDS